jgi:translation initiation factor 4E
MSASVKLLAGTMDGSSEPTPSSLGTVSAHKLYDNWTLWAHLPHDVDWTVNSYKQITTLNSVESTIAVCETLPEKMINNCMLFLMRKGILPMWEDPLNRKGGCFSYKVLNKNVAIVWRNLSYTLVGESLTADKALRPKINGITISPKKNFCIIKIWLADCNYQNPTVISDLAGITAHGCLFKKHL